MSSQPKVLLFDIETSPVKAWIWRTGYKINVLPNQIVKGQKFDIICICYKWAHEKTIHSLDWGINAQNSAKMVKKFAEIVSEADVVIAQNGDQFDIKQLNTQRLLHGQGPIKWPTSEDTLKMLRKNFYLPAYGLDYAAKLLTGAGKDRMEFQDWIDIVEDKDPKALAKMIKYCKRDVKKLQEVWEKIRPYCEPKAHRGIITGQGRDSCPNCGSTHYVRNGYKISRVGKYQMYQCRNCGYNWKDSRLAR